MSSASSSSSGNDNEVGLQDTLNATWKNDKTRFGFKMLQKMGWKEDKGLGKNESGSVSSIKVSKREEGLGLGMEKLTDGAGSKGWSATATSFNDILKVLNESYKKKTKVKKSVPKISVGMKYKKHSAAKDLSTKTATEMRAILGSAASTGGHVDSKQSSSSSSSSAAKKEKDCSSGGSSGRNDTDGMDKKKRKKKAQVEEEEEEEEVQVKKKSKSKTEKLAKSDPNPDLSSLTKKSKKEKRSKQDITDNDNDDKEEIKATAKESKKIDSKGKKDKKDKKPK